jgi:hypothetical protein
MMAKYKNRLKLVEERQEEQAEKAYGESKTVRTKNPNKLVAKKKLKYKKPTGRPKKPKKRAKKRGRPRKYKTPYTPISELSEEEAEKRREYWRQLNEERRDYYQRYWKKRKFLDEKHKEKNRKTQRKRSKKQRNRDKWYGSKVYDDEGNIYYGLTKVAPRINRHYHTVKQYLKKGVIPPATYFNWRGYRVFSQHQVRVMKTALKKKDNREWTLAQASRYMYCRWKEEFNNEEPE